MKNNLIAIPFYALRAQWDILLLFSVQVCGRHTEPKEKQTEPHHHFKVS